MIVAMRPQESRSYHRRFSYYQNRKQQLTKRTPNLQSQQNQRAILGSIIPQYFFLNLNPLGNYRCLKTPNSYMSSVQATQHILKIIHFRKRIRWQSTHTFQTNHMFKLIHLRYKQQTHVQHHKVQNTHFCQVDLGELRLLTGCSLWTSTCWPQASIHLGGSWVHFGLWCPAHPLGLVPAHLRQRGCS